MSTEIIIWKMRDGTVAVTTASPNIDIRDCVKHKPDEAISHRITTEDKLPQDREFRNAWTDANPTDTVDIDMPKAVEIHKDKLRRMRKPLLEKADVEFMQALEAGDARQIAAVKAKKQALRDATSDSSILSAKDPEALKRAVPACLKEG